MCNHLKKIVVSSSFINRHKTAPEYFTRDRKLPFPTLIIFLINFIKRSLQSELDSFFQTLNGALTPISEVTKSAFVQARNKIHHDAFTELNQHLISFVENNSTMKTWNGFRLLAIDGTTLRLPKTPKVIKHFDTQPNATDAPRPMAQASQIYDVLNRLSIHAALNPYRIDERELAMQHGSYIMPNDLLILDRGYPAFWFFSWILSESVQFCARVSVTSWSEVRRFYQSGKKEQIVTINPTYESRKKCLAYGLPLTPIRVRLVRISIPGAEDTILMTSLLDTKQYPHALFRDLYHQRWGIEENYKTMKSRLEIENFSGKSVESIYQDFYAKIFSMNLTAVLIRPVQAQIDKDESNDQPYRYQINFTYALSCLKNTIILIFQRSRPHRLLRNLFLLFQKTVEPIRPNRSNPRKKVVRNQQTYYTCYKPTA
ncbi:MAG: IS4 family transposase [candidate division Zixibacteria bacterium]|nr:IS4 family transposase [candidate division Zixibacteria bacterium]